jgi:protein ImuA
MLTIGRDQLVKTLREKVHRLEARHGAGDKPTVTSGCNELDQLLPEGEGFKRGTVVEWLATSRGGGAGTLALIAAKEACREGRVLIVLDGRRRFYPPAAAALGIDLSNLILVRARSAADELWALDQTLRCPAVGAVWGRLEKLDSRAQRRLQLAAEAGGTLGLLLRPAKIRGQPTWAAMQLLVDCGGGMSKSFNRDPLGERVIRSRHALPFGSRLNELPHPQSCRRLRVQVVRCHGGQEGATVEIAIDETTGLVRAVNNHETLPLPVAAPLARSAARRSGFPA